MRKLRKPLLICTVAALTVSLMSVGVAGAIARSSTPTVRKLAKQLKVQGKQIAQLERELKAVQSQGSTGSQGPKGDSGATGQPGEAGAQGPAGPASSDNGIELADSSELGQSSGVGKVAALSAGGLLPWESLPIAFAEDPVVVPGDDGYAIADCPDEYPIAVNGGAYGLPDDGSSLLQASYPVHVQGYKGHATGWVGEATGAVVAVANCAKFGSLS